MYCIHVYIVIEFSGLFAAKQMKIDLNLRWISLQALQLINHWQLRKPIL